MDSSDDHNPAETTIRVQRSRRLIHLTSSSVRSTIEITRNDNGNGKDREENYLDSDDEDEFSNPRVAIVLQPLLNVITNIFTQDKLADNGLSLSSFVKMDFTDLDLLGQGTSFIVRRLPDIPQGYVAGGVVTSSRRNINSSNGPNKSVSKQLLATRWRGQKEKSRQLLELVINELQIITHRPLKMHENIIKFRGVMWEYDTDLQVWPVLVLEFADFGTLSDFQARPMCLTFETKMNLCLDVGSGLEALHKCGIIHGDIKSENVFVFKHEARGYIAKLGDFSSSSISLPTDEDSDPTLDLLGYTPLWIAPEYQGPAPFSTLAQSDVFAFGLLIWTIMCNGDRFFAGLKVDTEDELKELNDLKQSAKLLEVALMMSSQFCKEEFLTTVAELFVCTLRSAGDRDFGRTLRVLRSFCSRTDPVFQGSNIDDPQTGIFGTKIRNVDPELLSRFPRPLQLQIMQNTWAIMPEYGIEGEDPSERKSTSQVCLASRLIYKNIGHPTMGELIAKNEIQHIMFKSDMDDPEKLKNSLLGTDNSVVEEMIRGSICDGSPTFGPQKYCKYRNRRTTSALEVLSICAKADSRFNDATQVLCVMALALGRGDIMNTESFANWLRLAPYMTNLNLLRGICELIQGNYPQRKRQILDFVAHLSQLEAQSQEFRARIQDFRNKSAVGNRQLFENFQRDLLSSLPGVDRQASWYQKQDSILNIESFKKTAPENYPGKEPPGDDLHSLAGQGSSLSELERLLDTETPSSLETKDAAGRTPLFLACTSANYPATMSLLKHGADASVLSGIGVGVLHFLHYFEPEERVQIANETIRAGANPNVLVSLGNKLSTLCDRHMPGLLELNAANGSPLHRAILHNDLDAVNVLLSHGADCMLEDSEHISPLLLSVSLHCPEILERLLDATKIDVKTWYDYYGNRLAYAALDGKWDELRMAVHTTAFFIQAEQTLSLLQAKGVNWDDLSVGWDLPAIHFAALRSHVNTMALLLKMGLEYQIDKSSSVAFPLHTVIQSGDEYKFILLLDHGASVHHKIGGSNDTCLHLCIKTGFQDTFFLETLLKHGADIEAKNNKAETPYCVAVARQQFKAADVLLKMGANPNPLDYKNTTVLGTLLTYYDNILPSLRYLLDPDDAREPASFIVEPRGKSTALHIAAGARWTKRSSGQMIEIMKYLLSKFPYEEHLEAQEVTSGFTPLICAVLANNFEAVRALLAAGASLDTPCIAGVSLRGAQFIWVYGKGLGLFKGSEYDADDEAFIKKWRKMSMLLLAASDKPVVLPKEKEISKKEDPMFRLNEFFRIAKENKLQCPETVGGMDCFPMPKDRDLDESEKRLLFVPKDYLAEAAVLTVPSIRQSAFIVDLVGYMFKQVGTRGIHSLVPLMPYSGITGPLSEFLISNPDSTLLQRLRLCQDIIVAISTVHDAGFIHGCLNPSNIFIVEAKRRPEMQFYCQLWNFEKSVSENDEDIDLLYSRQDSPYDAPEVTQKPQTHMSFEALKQCDIFSLGVVLLYICGNGMIDAPGSPETNPNYYDTALARIEEQADNDDEETKMCAREMIIPMFESLVKRDVSERATNLDGVGFVFREVPGEYDG